MTDAVHEIVSEIVPDHYPVECGYDNLRRELMMVCECGYAAYGRTWEEAGADMDDHLKEEEATIDAEA